MANKKANKKLPYKVMVVQLVFNSKECTGFEPARQGKLGSPDFESGALPLCQHSTTMLL